MYPGVGGERQGSNDSFGPKILHSKRDLRVNRRQGMGTLIIDGDADD